LPTKLLPFSTRVHTRSRGYLPHWEIDNAIYFITYRLADSLPRHVVEQLRDEYAAMIRMITGGVREPKFIERENIRARFGLRLDEYLDQGRGACYLKLPAIASNVVETWRHFDRSRYELLAWCVMPNHFTWWCAFFRAGS
jgi:hypothetical protein